MKKKFITLEQYIEATGIRDDKELHARNMDAVIESAKLKAWSDTGFSIDDAYDFKVPAFYADMSVSSYSLIQLKMLHLIVSESIYLHRRHVAFSKSLLSAYFGTSFNRIKESFLDMKSKSGIYNVSGIDNRIVSLPGGPIIDGVGISHNAIAFAISEGFFKALVDKYNGYLYSSINHSTIKRMTSVCALAAYPVFAYYSMLATNGMLKQINDVRFRNLIGLDSRGRKTAVSQSEFRKVILPRVFEQINDVDQHIDTAFSYDEVKGKIAISFFQEGLELSE